VTRDGGKKWVQRGTPLLPPRGKPDKQGVEAAGVLWVSTIEASRFKEGRAYVCLDGHRADNDGPHLMVTEDFGENWQDISSNLPKFGSTRCLREDVKNPNLLYCGTEFHVFASIDRGKSWTKINNNLPTVSIHEIAVHPTAGEIVAATHGRSLWILDISALRQITPDFANGEQPHLYKPQTAVRWQTLPAHGRTNRRFVGENPPPGAQIYYSLGKKADKISMRIVDINGDEMADSTSAAKGAKPRLEIKAEPGLHRVTWDLTKPTGEAAMAKKKKGGFFTPRQFVSPGNYRVILTVDGQDYSRSFQVEADPNAPPNIVPAELEERKRVVD
jgi:hypothetical protein